LTTHNRGVTRTGTTGTRKQTPAPGHTQVLGDRTL